MADDGFLGACLVHELIVGAFTWLDINWPGGAREEWAWSHTAGSETLRGNLVEHLQDVESDPRFVIGRKCDGLLGCRWGVPAQTSSL